MLTKRRRRTLFALLGIAFLVSAVLTTYYIQGWRFDFQKFSVSKVGAIYIRSYPMDAAISIDGKPAANGSWFLSRGTFISDLFPKNYRVSLSEPGYEPWHETVTVLPSLVTEINPAVLVPKDAKPLALPAAADGVEHFWLTGAGLLVKNRAGGLTINSQTVPGDAPLPPVSADTHIVSLDSASGIYYSHNPADGADTNLNTLFARNNINLKASRVIESGKQLIVATNSRITVWDIDKLVERSADAEDMAVALGKIGAPSDASFDPASAQIALSQFYLAWNMRTAGGSYIAVYDRYLGKLVSASPEIPEEAAELSWSSQGVLGILGTDGDLSTFDPSPQAFTRVASDVTSFSWYSDGVSLAALEHSALEVFLRSGDVNYYRFRLPNPGSFTHLIWYEDGAHLFLAGEDHATFLDFKDNTLENLTGIENARDVQYDPSTNTLYFIRDGKLMSLAFPP